VSVYQSKEGFPSPIEALQKKREEKNASKKTPGTKVIMMMIMSFPKEKMSIKQKVAPKLMPAARDVYFQDSGSVWNPRSKSLKQ